MQCHYEVLNVPQDADSAAIKKAHRKLAIRFHPDKNLNDDEAAEKFRLVQEAYECLSDAAERKWYDEHRDALLKGWTPNSGAQENGVHMLFDVIPFMHAHCYTGYEDGDDQSFYGIYGQVFASLAKEEADAAGGNGKSDHSLPFEFGNTTTDLGEVASFYQVWEGFVSQQTFSWADQYDLKDAENRRIRRAMEDENKKARKTAKKARNEDILALVRFCKRRDPRIKALKEKQEEDKTKREKEQAETKRLKKQEKQEAREQWRQQAEEEQAQAQEMDRLAGRVRLADLEDDYDYGGGKKKGKKGKRKSKNRNNDQGEEYDNKKDQEEAEGQGETNADEDDAGSEPVDEEAGGETNTDDSGEQEVPLDHFTEADGDFSDESESSEEEPEVWRCECCRKDFKSQGQMDNHMKSKKHKEAYKKYQKKLEKELMRE